MGSAAVIPARRRSCTKSTSGITCNRSCQPGCNPACHGAAAGQNGFKLSLRGYDDEGDYLALTRHAHGRRIVPSDPGRSLMLLKPTGAVPHKGGKKFEVDSLEYRILSGWIAAGAPPPKQDEPRISRIEILPPASRLAPNTNQQLIVRAHFSDGHAEDVTRWAKYTDANSAVTQVDESGNVKVLGYGEGAVTAWYLSRIAIATVAVPYENKVAPEVFAQSQRRNFIDDLVLEKLQSLNLPPSPPASDAEFIRRAYLETIGVLPTVQETRDFLASRAENKRDALIESPGAVARTLVGSGPTCSRSAARNFGLPRCGPTTTGSTECRENTLDEFVRRLVTAKGSTLENGAAFRAARRPAQHGRDNDASVSGMSINCARCHNHPLENGPTTNTSAGLTCSRGSV